MATRAHDEQAARIQSYYTFQSKIYDLSRWSFLFGRRKIIQLLPFEHEEPFQLLEIGCGTGINLAYAQQLYPKAQFTGLDVSEDMLKIAHKRLDTSKDKVKLIHRPYEKSHYAWTGKVDVVLFSYALTMINPQWEELILQAYQDLKPGGYIAIADFYDSNWSFFKNHMGNHHVRMDGHLVPVLKANFTTFHESIKPAYGGLWHYFKWIGRKQ